MSQREFLDGVEAARAWMEDVEKRLSAVDDTQGPRDALEARMRETQVRRVL